MDHSVNLNVNKYFFKDLWTGWDPCCSLSATVTLGNRESLELMYVEEGRYDILRKVLRSPVRQHEQPFDDWLPGLPSPVIGAGRLVNGSWQVIKLGTKMMKKIPLLKYISFTFHHHTKKTVHLNVLYQTCGLKYYAGCHKDRTLCIRLASGLCLQPGLMARAEQGTRYWSRHFDVRQVQWSMLVVLRQ